MRLLRRLVASLIVGALFGWAMSTKLPLDAALLSGVAAAAYMAGSLTLIELADRRKRSSRAETAAE